MESASYIWNSSHIWRIMSMLKVDVPLILRVWVAAWSCLAIWIWMLYCSGWLFFSWWYNFPMHFPTEGCDITTFVVCFRQYAHIFVVLFAHLIWSYVQMTFVKSYSFYDDMFF